MPPARRMLLVGLSLAGLGAMGWWGAASLIPRTSAQVSPDGVDEQAQNLLVQSNQAGGLSAAERQRLLERMLALGRLKQAQQILEPWLEEQPRSLSLALLMADLRRQNKDLSGARRDLNQLLRLHPNHPRVLEQIILLDQAENRSPTALGDLNRRFKAQIKGQRIELGLLLADLQRQLGQSDQATKTYLLLAEESPEDSRSLLALAMLRQEQGKTLEVQTLLAKARQRHNDLGINDGFIDELAARWGLSSARIRVSKPNPLKAPVETP